MKTSCDYLKDDVCAQRAQKTEYVIFVLFNAYSMYTAYKAIANNAWALTNNLQINA